jgi:hypothetical protein
MKLPPDIYDGAPWTDTAIADLKITSPMVQHCRRPRTFCADRARRLEVAAKAKELGLTWQRGGRKRKGSEKDRR